MNNLKELEKKYEELGKEIERLKKEQEIKTDPIFLLSKEEYGKYKDKIPQINCWWWLRSPGYYSNDAASVLSDGSVYHDGYFVYNDHGAVRPAFKISNISGLSSDGKNKIVYNGVTWVKIDEDLYISELPIDFRRFDEKSNNYETSEVRKFLLYWYEDRMVLN